jgi:hypothetical protein
MAYTMPGIAIRVVDPPIFLAEDDVRNNARTATPLQWFDVAGARQFWMIDKVCPIRTVT